MTRSFRRTLCATVLVLGSHVAIAQDLLLQPRPGELLVGPLLFSQSVLGIDLPLRVSAFLVATPDDDRLRVDVRVVTDLFKLQENIGGIIDRVPLPTDNCPHFGIDILVARIWGKRITINGNVATLTLSGDAENWACGSLFGQIAKNRNFEASFDATIPFTLERADSHTVAVKLDRPSVDPHGPLGGVVSELFRIVGVDINRMAKEALDRTIDSKLLRVTVPDYLLWLNPDIQRAELVSNNGALAASVEMSATLDPNSIAELLLMLWNRPQAIIETGAVDTPE